MSLPMKLRALPTLEEARVWAEETPVGLLRRTGVDVEFTYDERYQGLPIATTLPVRTEPYSTGNPGAVPAFFAGLLPEGRRMTALRRAVKTSADDDLSMLLAVGTDMVGHVRVLPLSADGSTGDLEPGEAESSGKITTFSDMTFTELFAQVLANDPADRVGLPGIQDKVSEAMITLPVSHRDRRWILKFNPPEFPHLVENEAFFLSAAKKSGLSVAHHELVYDSEGKSGLLIERFDRRSGRRLAQEDGCQVCDRYPADKYRIDTEELFTELSRACGAPTVAARDLMRQLVFAFLSCNGDAHAKNFSIQRDLDGEWAVTPAYDLPSTHPYGDYSMALRVGGKDKEDVGRQDFVALGEHVGLRERATLRIIERLLKALPSWVGDLGNLPFDQKRIHKLRRAIEYRAKRLG